MVYYRPIAMTDPHRPKDAVSLVGGWCWFSHVECMERGRVGEVVPAAEVPDDVLTRLSAPRAPIAGLDLTTPRIMSILNVTPDSFSDGGMFNAPDAALAQARAMVADGADIIDIGGESTRPGAVTVDVNEEIERTAPVIKAMRAGSDVAISIDTRKAPVAQAALDAGASLVNDVAALTFDPDMPMVTAKANAPCCLMHAQGDPATMQDDPTYVNVMLDVYDFLNARIQAAEAAGIRRDQIIVDPGIGFGKTQEHNLTLLRNLSIFHGLGCAVLLGASRKRFIGTIGQAPDAHDRLGGSVAVALHGLSQGMQFLRVHDTLPTKQAMRLFLAVN
ncbi:dihydropteroate synthase [Octadecabacter temperatus]|uniref:Dihydropteroate synthase n=1 Tax=Octadecabacter temperatus TaxID=1458307 RepID=A0A0K0Y3M9_9RHOB|nr:dihydropteroate synthase [Octadecabacter temperatus]AKS45530.1 Dihydropteroate synthase [Octadecabacter temperatus]SIN95002.1 dihydropteroate synthase [Octadecabacter temperatus]